jgi:hypothetical protein
MSINVDELPEILNCLTTATPSITSDAVIALADGFAITAFVTIAVVDDGTVYTTGASPKAPCETAADASVWVVDRKVKIDADGTDVTTQVPSVPVVPVLTRTISPIAKPCAADVEIMAVKLVIAWLEIAPPIVTPELKIAEPLGVTEAEPMLPVVTTYVAWLRPGNEWTGNMPS